MTEKTPRFLLLLGAAVYLLVIIVLLANRYRRPDFSGPNPLHQQTK